MVYLHLFHGRKTIDEDMDDWGESGPVLGPVPYVHTTYQCNLSFGDDFAMISIKDDVILYEGMYYGDWSVFDKETYQNGLAIGHMSVAVLPKLYGTANANEVEVPHLVGYTQ